MSVVRYKDIDRLADSLSAVKPNSLSAALFQLTIVPDRSLLMMASKEESTMAANLASLWLERRRFGVDRSNMCIPALRCNIGRTLLRSSVIYQISEQPDKLVRAALPSRARQHVDQSIEVAEIMPVGV